MNKLQVNVSYIPPSSTEWRMLDSGKELEIAEEEKYINHGIFDDFEIKGLWDHNRMNENMQSFIMKLGISDQTTEGLI